MKTRTKPADNYVEITAFGNVTISFPESRPLLGRIGIPGEIQPAPGHSDDSVSLLRERGAARVYPAHGPVRPTWPRHSVVADKFFGGLISIINLFLAQPAKRLGYHPSVSYKTHIAKRIDYAIH